MTESKSKLASKWASNTKALKAVQVAFDMDEKLQYVIRREAIDAGVGPTDQIRTILALPQNKRPKRPRLTVSLSPDDYNTLAERYGIDAEDQLEIKKRVMAELVDYATDQVDKY
ncbi:hypothetical protein HR060_03540 [Catenovulum sp. SM1970]|uniref:hypothetical protein n=1 Tax=Marinifaba aquimaris TaxID=2741323 RepID=UPI0015735863|nr:hypothetical protein [Marinifaba aquimaris]NTS75932.1 hypothetical protein [Marinifaba aquimaris]